MQSILRTIICDEFEKNIGRMQQKEHLAGKPMYAMQINFRLDEKNTSEDLFPGVQLLIFAETNYVGVYYRESETRDEYGDWQRLSCHDSCWRLDGVDRFLSLFRDRFSILGWHSGICNNQWYLKREISLDEVQKLRQK